MKQRQGHNIESCGAVLPRRSFVSGMAAAGAIVCAPAWAIGEERSPGNVLAPPSEEEEEVAPPEDLMREHGVLNRILLIYEESASAARGGAGRSRPDPLAKGAAIIRTLHRGLPREARGRSPLPALREGGGARRSGRRCSAASTRRAAAHRVIQRLSRRRSRAQGAPRADALAERPAPEFVRMYRPHEAREDTVLFPAFRKLVSRQRIRRRSVKTFEDKEHRSSARWLRENRGPRRID